jgi:hypothetical protein
MKKSITMTWPLASALIEQAANNLDNREYEALVLLLMKTAEEYYNHGLDDSIKDEEPA